MKRHVVAGIVYGERNMNGVEVNGSLSVDPEPVMNKKENYEFRINSIARQLRTRPDFNGTFYKENGQKTILEDGTGAKYEVSDVEGDSVLITELDCNGDLTDVTRKYNIYTLAKLIYTNHFGFNMAFARNLIKYGTELHEYELSKYWN